MKPCDYTTDIGLEVHIELATASKIFCGCSTAFGAKPNTQVCPVCLGMPGSLPVLNRRVVEYAVLLGHALHCEIASSVTFDRKNYFYPDNPQNYQISQLYQPICRGGWLEISVGQSSKRVGIHEIHMEEDAGKLIHDEAAETTVVDYNRAGVPLLELVTEPCLHSAEEVDEFLHELIAIVRYLEISDCRLNEGSMRVDVNLSLRPVEEAQQVKGDNGAFSGRENAGLGVRTEMKNLNSFKAVSRAIREEAARQRQVLAWGGAVEMETRRWDDVAGRSYVMRGKEEASDYRYFPEPDLPPVELDQKWVRQLKERLVELPAARRKRFVRQYGLEAYASDVLTRERALADYYECVLETEEIAALAEEKRRRMAKSCANFLMGDCASLAKESGTQEQIPPFQPKDLAALVLMLEQEKISGTTAKEVLRVMYREKTDPVDYVRAHGLFLLSDKDAIAPVVQRVIEENPKSVADYRAGKTRAAGYLVGQVMKAFGGKAAPAVVKSLVEQFLLYDSSHVV